MKKQPVNPEKLVILYNMRKDKKSLKEIFEATGIANSTVICAERYMDRYMDNPYNAPENYKKAIKMLKGSQSIKETSVQEPVLTNTEIKEDEFTKIDQAFEAFQKSVIDFIEVQVNRNTEDINRKSKLIEQENLNLKKEIMDMTPIVEKAKQSNMIYMLRSKFNGEK